MEIRLASDWDYIKAKLTFAARNRIGSRRLREEHTDHLRAQLAPTWKNASAMGLQGHRSAASCLPGT